MDLSLIERHETAEIKIYDPFGMETDITAEMYSRDSQVFRDAQKANQIEASDSEEAKAEKSARITLSCVKQWRNVELNGKPVNPADDESVKYVASESGSWLFNQIYSALNNQSLFFSKKAKSS